MLYAHCGRRNIINIDLEKAIEIANTTHGVCIAMSSSERKGIDGICSGIYNTLDIITRRELITYTVALGTRREQGPYIAEPAEIALALRYSPHRLVGRRITIFTSNLGALLAMSQPRH